jgi:hypothetical protein
VQEGDLDEISIERVAEYLPAYPSGSTLRFPVEAVPDDGGKRGAENRVTRRIARQLEQADVIGAAKRAELLILGRPSFLFSTPPSKDVLPIPASFVSACASLS